MAQSEHLYYGLLSHEDRMANLPEGKLGEAVVAEVERDGSDLSATVFVLAPSQTEAENRAEEHYGWKIPMTLVPSGFATIMSSAEVGAAVGVRGGIDWNELNQCPMCHGHELRNDASEGCTDCVSCGWSLDWKGTE